MIVVSVMLVIIGRWIIVFAVDASVVVWTVIEMLSVVWRVIVMTVLDVVMVMMVFELLMH